MYFETIKNLLCDEVAETIAALAIEQVIEHNGTCYGIPRTVVRSGRHCVMGWCAGILHGIHGDVDIINDDGTTAGQIPVKKLCDILAGEQFTIRSAIPDDDAQLIHNAQELAQYLGTTTEKIPEMVNRYCDYETKTFVDDEAVVFITTAGETGKREQRGLLYPFSTEAYRETISGLQCWADATYWEAVNKGEV